MWLKARQVSLRLVVGSVTMKHGLSKPISPLTHLLPTKIIRGLLQTTEWLTLSVVARQIIAGLNFVYLVHNITYRSIMLSDFVFWQIQWPLAGNSYISMYVGEMLFRVTWPFLQHKMKNTNSDIKWSHFVFAKKLTCCDMLFGSS